MWKSWLQSGYGPWTVSGDWFTVTEKSTSSGNYHEQDNGLGVALLPGAVGTFNNSVNTTSTSNQILIKTGASNNYAFTFQLSTNTSETGDSSSNVSFPKLHRGAITNVSGSGGEDGDHHRDGPADQRSSECEQVSV